MVSTRFALVRFIPSLPISYDVALAIETFIKNNTIQCFIQYCAKEMQTKFGVFRSLFSRKFDEISPRSFVKALANFRQVKRNFAVILAKFCIHWSEISFSRNFVGAKFRNSENSRSRNFAAGKFPQSEILLAVEKGCNKNLLFGQL